MGVGGIVTLTSSEERRLDEIERELTDDLTLRQLSASLASAGHTQRRRIWSRILRFSPLWIAGVFVLVIGLCLDAPICSAAGISALITVILAISIPRGGRNFRRG